MVKSIKENFLKDSNQEEVFIHIEVELFMKGNGSRTEKAVLEYTLTQIKKDIKVIGSMVKNMLKDLTITKMETSILVSGSKIRKMEMVSYSILQALYMMVNGLTIKHAIRAN